MSDRQTVLELDQLRVQALIEKDLAVLEQIISDDCSHVESSGKARTKAELLAGLRGGDYSFASFVIDENDVRIYGDTAIVTGRYHNEIRTPQGLQPAKYARHLRVYVRGETGWRNVAHQATEMPKVTERQ